MTPERRFKGHFDGRAQTYDSFHSDPFSQHTYERWEEILDENLKGEVVLDIGCGTGAQTIFLSKRGFSVVGLDISREMIRETAEKIVEMELREKISLVCADARYLPFKDEVVDGVVSMFVTLSLAMNTFEAFHELSRVLKNRGVVIVDVYNKWPLSLFRELLHSLKAWRDLAYRFAHGGLKEGYNRPFRMNHNLTEHVFTLPELKIFCTRADLRIERTIAISLLWGIFYSEKLRDSNRILAEKLIKGSKTLEKTMSKLPIFNSIGFEVVVIARKKRT